MKAGELKTFLRKDEILEFNTETAKYEQNVLRSPDYAKQLNNSP